MGGSYLGCIYSIQLFQSPLRPTVVEREVLYPIPGVSGQPVGEDDLLSLKYTLGSDVLPQGGVIVLNAGFHGYLTGESTR